MSDSPSREQIQEQVDRIAQSGGFIGSASLRGVLLYLSQHAIKHPGEPIKEYEIATEVLQRGQNFDSRIDSTVRGIASRLRSKLAEYYQHEGTHDSVLVDLPKGSYALSFSFRESALLRHEPREAKGIEVAPAAPSRRRFPRSTIAVAGLLFIGLGYWTGRSTRPSAPASIRTFWGDFLKGGDPLIIFPNPTFRGLPKAGMQLVEPDNPHVDGTIDMFTGTGETIALEHLTRQLLELGHDSRAKRAHLFTWDDATNASLIFLGGQIQNEAFAQLPKLQRFTLKSPDEEPFLQQGAVHDEKPAAGGESYYLASKDFNNGNDYAVIALTPGVSQNHRILILAGTNTYGSEGAADFLCDPDLLKDLLDKLGVQKNGPVPPFEALLRIPERGGAPISPQLVITYKRQSEAGSEGSR